MVIKPCALLFRKKRDLPVLLIPLQNGRHETHHIQRDEPEWIMAASRSHVLDKTGVRGQRI